MNGKEKLENRRRELLTELQIVEDQLENYDSVLRVNPDKPYYKWTLAETSELYRINPVVYEWFNSKESPENLKKSINDYNALHLVKVDAEG